MVIRFQSMAMKWEPNVICWKGAQLCAPTFLLFLIVPLAFARSNTAIKAFNQGVKAFNAKQFNEAVPAFDEAISADSEFVEAYFARGACKYYLKSLDGSIMDLNETLRQKPDYVDARALRGAVYYEMDQWDNALEDFTAVLAKTPRDAQSLLGRAVILLKREDLDGASRDFKGFLRVRPEDPLAPRVRQLLASLKRVGGAEKPPVEETTGENTAQQPAHSAPHRPAAAHAPTSADLQKLADSLLSRPLSQSYERKVLRGEQAQVVGDIRSVPGMPAQRKAPDESPQIVDPR
jgi:tetratricopeptide (TPR) repeat protein